jgi:predicted nucleic acid-binding protein
MVSAIEIFIDSSILVEYNKGNGIDFLNNLIGNNFNLYINQIVASEFLYHYIAGFCKKSPLSAKVNKEIPKVFENNNPIEFFECFTHVDCSQEIIDLAIDFMQKYNILPNDALILASCKLNQIKYLATYDSDFNEAYKQEDIIILNSLTQIAKL